MANLPENTRYNNAGSQPTVANLSNLIKNIQQKSQETASTATKSIIPRHFNPEAASRIFSAPSAVDTGPVGTFPVGEPIGSQMEGAKTEPLLGYEKFVQPDERGLWAAPSDQATLRNWPTALGGGQYVVDPTQKGALIKSERVLWDDELNPGARKSALGGLSSKLYQVDHIVPLWLGGGDTIANSQILDIPTHKRKTAVQSVPLTLLAKGKIDLNQAKLMALTWKDKDASGLPDPDENGYLPLELAEKYAQKWEKDKTKSQTGKYFKESLKETWEKSLPGPIGAFIKGGISGLTAGIIPSGASGDETTAEKIAGTAGNIVGTVWGLGKFAKGLGYGMKGIKALTGGRKALSLADEAMKTAGLVTDIGDVASAASKARLFKLKRMAASAGLLSAWGQMGLSGREITGQQEAELKNHMTQFFTDVAFGGLLGASNQSVKGYATVGLGTTALSLMEGEEIVPALQNAALMTALHAVGYKSARKNLKTVYGNEEAYKMSANTFNQWLGDVVPTVKKGQPVPEILKLDIPKVDSMRAEFQKKYPNDQRFKTLGPITNEAEAIDFMERAARRRLGDLIAKSDGKIPQEEIKKEMTRIVVAKNQLYNQTLPPEARAQKEWADLVSMGEKLKPTVKSEQLRPAINKTQVLNEMPFKFPEQIYDNPQGLKFPTGNVPTTGYGGNIDVVSKKTINDYYNNPKNFSEKLFVVKDPETAAVMRTVEAEQIAAGQRPTVGNPDHALRVFVKVQTPEGIEVRPAGYMPREVSFDVKKDNLNKTYYEITNRLRHTVETAKSPEELRKTINADKAVIDIDEKAAKHLFERKDTLSQMPDEELYAILKPKNAYEKYDSKLNNSTIAEAMTKHGLDVLVVDKSKLMPIGGGPPRYNPENPYISLNLNEQDWLRSIALKNSEKAVPAPSKTIKSLISKKKAETISEKAGEVIKSTQMTPAPAQPPAIEVIKEATPPTKAPTTPKMPLAELRAPKTTPTPSPVVKAAEAVKTTPKKVIVSQKVALTQKPDLVNEFYQDMVARIDDLKPDLTSIPNHEKSLMAIVKDFKRKNPGLPPEEFKKVMDDAKSRAETYVRDLIDNAYTGTKIFGTEDVYVPAKKGDTRNVLVSRYKELVARGKEVGLKPFEKTEMADLKKKIEKHIDLDKEIEGLRKNKGDQKKIQELSKERFSLIQDYVGGKYDSLVIANKYGLELTPPNAVGLRYLKLDKSGNPSFTPEFIKANKLSSKDTPESVWGSFLKDDLAIYKDNLSKNSQEWAKGLDEMKKSKDPYAKAFAHTADEALAKKYGPNYRTSWKLNPALNVNRERGGLKELFNLTNEEGYSYSQPYRRTAAITAGKNYAEIEKAVARADAKTKAISEEAALKRAGDDIKLPDGMSGRVKDPNQIQNVHEDLTPFDMMMNGLLNAEARANLIERYNALRKEMGGGSAKHNAKIYDQMKELFAQIKKLSANIPEESKTWKLGDRIILKNGGKPTVEEGIKDGLRFAATVFKNKSTPGYVKFEDVRKSVLEKLQKTPDGKGGPYDGKGGLFDGIRSVLPGNTVRYEAPVEPTYDVRGLKVKDKDIEEAAHILYGEISNRTPDRQQFEVRHAINTAINRANSNPKKYGGSLTKVLQEPAQYQSYAPAGVHVGSKIVESQYQKLKKGALNEADKKKLQIIMDTLSEMKSGKFTDTTGGKQFYVHASDGTMWLGKTIAEAKKLANQHEKEIKARSTNWRTAPGLPAHITKN